MPTVLIWVKWSTDGMLPPGFIEDGEWADSPKLTHDIEKALQLSQFTAKQVQGRLQHYGRASVILTVVE